MSFSNTYWKPSPSAYSKHEDDERVIFIYARLAVMYDRDWKVLYRMKGKYTNLEAFENGMFIMLGEEMAKWVPKPAVVFTRAGHGSMHVIGKEILQFDEDMNLLNRTAAITHFSALHKAMMMIGATE